MKQVKYVLMGFVGVLVCCILQSGLVAGDSGGGLAGAGGPGGVAPTIPPKVIDSFLQALALEVVKRPPASRSIAAPAIIQAVNAVLSATCFAYAEDERNRTCWALLRAHESSSENTVLDFCELIDVDVWRVVQSHLRPDAPEASDYHQRLATTQRAREIVKQLRWEKFDSFYRAVQRHGTDCLAAHSAAKRLALFLGLPNLTPAEACEIYLCESDDITTTHKKSKMRELFGVLPSMNVLSGSRDFEGGYDENDCEEPE
ncbi:MAG: hypothetical protein WCJ17_00465 [bacterium]